jgi:phosphoribosylformylglycinamidine cyclo-ligase
MSHIGEEDEMYRTFNLGVGMVLVVEPANLQDVLDGSDGYVIGEVTKGDGSVSMV